MVDILPTTTTPPLATTAVSSAPAPISVLITLLPDKIQELMRQIQINTIITQVGNTGTIALNSPLGNLTVQLPNLPPVEQQNLIPQLLSLLENQKNLPLVVQPGSPPTQAVLLLPSLPSSVLQTPPATNALPLAGMPPPPLTRGTTLPAIVLPAPVAPPPMGGNSLPSPPPATAIAPLTPVLPAPLTSPSVAGTLLQSPPPPLTTGTTTPAPVLPAPPVAGNSLPSPPSTPLTTAPNTSPAVTTSNVGMAPTPTAPPAANPLPIGTTVTLHIDAILPPTATIATPLLPNQIIATVTRTGANNQPLLEAGKITLYVKQPVDVPVGTRILVTVEPAPTAPALLVLPVSGKLALSTVPQILAALAQIDPTLAQKIIEDKIPQPNAALPRTLLFLMNVLKQGDASSWLGREAVDALTRAGKGALIAQLTQELTKTGQAAQDDLVGAWKSWPVPLYTDNQLQILNLYVHREGNKNSEEQSTQASGNAATRFLIDLRMSQLGSLQLDGFAQPKKLDMMIRSEQALPTGLHNELRTAFTQALEAVDYSGSLNFQTGRHHWLNIRQAAGRTGTVVT